MQLEKKMHEQNEKFDEIKTTKTKKQKAMSWRLSWQNWRI